MVRESKAFWDKAFARNFQSHPFGDTITYQMGAEFIGDLPVEDWGCGLGWYRQYAKGPYCGLDGSPSRFCDKVGELGEYRSQTPALFMRHVLEHNAFDWQTILDNAVASFTKRMVLIIFTPFREFTIELKVEHEGDPPQISFAWSDVTDRFGDASWTSQPTASRTQHGVENVFYLEKP